MKKYKNKKPLNLHIAKNETWVDEAKKQTFTYSRIDHNWKKMIQELTAEQKIKLIYKYCLEGNRKLVKLLLESEGEKVDINQQDADNNSALMFAVKSGKKEVVEYLLEHGANTDYINILGFSPLHLAVRKNKIDIVELMLKHDANIEIEDAYGQTPIFEAVMENNIFMIDMLYSYNANLNHQNREGRTPLMVSAFNRNRQESMNKLLVLGVRVDELDNHGRTAFMHAINNNNGAMMDILLKAKTNLDIKDLCGYTPLMLCAKRGNREGIRVLVSRGANVFCRNMNDQKASDIASLLKHYTCAEVLKKAEKIYLQSIKNPAILSTLLEFSKQNRMDNSCIK